MVKITIVNVIATASLGQKLVLNKLAELKEIVYNPIVYRGRVAYFKAEGMEGRVSLFSTGKMISVGTKSEKRAFEELNCVMNFLVERNFAKEVKLNIIIQNIVVSADFETSINLEEIATITKGIYEPEQFPALILKIDTPYKTTALLFASGKAVITGLKKSEHIKPSVQMIAEIISSTDS
jgi:TATA-box binding protein (TBP) (component of TFIID and TFIIIB)